MRYYLKGDLLSHFIVEPTDRREGRLRAGDQAGLNPEPGTAQFRYYTLINGSVKRPNDGIKRTSK